MTVAVIDAYHNPNAEADLAVYRSTYGLSPCTTQNGCFTQVTSNGDHNWARTQHRLGPGDLTRPGRGLAICPNCNILLVESYGGWIKGLGKAVNEAVKMGADAISNSYDNRTKDRNVHLNEKYFNHPGIAITVASGDWGYDDYHTFPTSRSTWSPWAAPTCTGTGASEAGPRPRGPGTGAAARTCSRSRPGRGPGLLRPDLADVAADASPTSGAAVYDTFGYGGWLVVGGTSLSSPLIASVFALAGDKITYAERVYQNPGKLFDVTSGSDGSCGGSYLCTAGPGTTARRAGDAERDRRLLIA